MQCQIRKKERNSNKNDVLFYHHWRAHEKSSIFIQENCAHIVGGRNNMGSFYCFGEPTVARSKIKLYQIWLCTSAPRFLRHVCWNATQGMLECHGPAGKAVLPMCAQPHATSRNKSHTSYTAALNKEHYCKWG